MSVKVHVGVSFLSLCHSQDESGKTVGPEHSTATSDSGNTKATSLEMELHPKNHVTCSPSTDPEE